jgi:hypothetical protein
MYSLGKPKVILNPMDVTSVDLTDGPWQFVRPTHDLRNIEFLMGFDLGGGDFTSRGSHDKIVEDNGYEEMFS